MVHRDREHSARYHRDWSPVWGYRRSSCDCGRDDPDEFVWVFIGSLFGLAAAVVTLAAAIVRRPLLAAAVTVGLTVTGLVAVLVSGWPL